MAFIDSTAEDMTGNRESERGSDTQQRDEAGSRTQIRCRALAHGTRALPTELNGAATQNISGASQLNNFLNSQIHLK